MFLFRGSEVIKSEFSSEWMSVALLFYKTCLFKDCMNMEYYITSRRRDIIFMCLFKFIITLHGTLQFNLLSSWTYSFCI
jgi:hypothetical protein